MRRAFAALCVSTVAVTALLSSIETRAATRDWNAANGDWYTPGNWNPNGTPAANDTLNIASGTATLTTGPDLTINGGGSINLSGTGVIDRSTTHWTRFGEGSAGTYTQTDGTFTSNSGRFYMGLSGGSLTADISDGTFSYTNGGDFIVGNDTAVGTLDVSGGTFNAASANFRVGVDNSGSGEGNFHVSGSADVNLYWLSIAQGNANSVGHVTVDGGTLDISRGFRVGLGGAGTYTQNGGTVTAVGGDDHFLGSGSGSAVVTINNGTLTHTGGNTRLGVDTTGTLNINGGDVNVNWLSIAQGGASSEGHVVMTDGTLDVNQRIRVATSTGTTATFTQSGGTVGGTNVRPVWVAEGASSTGTYSISDGVLNASELYVAQGGGSTGNFNQTGGTVNVSGNSSIGAGASATGTYSISDGTFNYTNGGDFIVGNGTAVGTLNVSGGTFNADTGNFRVGVNNSGAGEGNFNISGGDVDLRYLSVAQGNANSVGHMTVDGGTLDISRGFRVGLGGAGTYTQNGGTVTAIGGDDHFLGSGTGSAVVTINDGTLTHTGGNTRLGVDTTGTLNINGGDVNVNWLSMAQGNANSQGHVVMTDGTLDVNERIRVGTSTGTTGTFTQSGGIVGGTNVRPVWVAEGASSTGTYSISDGVLNASELLIAQAGGSTGTFEQTGGTVNVSGNSFIGNAGVTGTYNISDGQVNFNGADLYLARGAGSTGIVNQTGGTVAIASWFNVGAHATGTGEYNVSNGTLSSSVMAIGREGYGEMTIGQPSGNTTTVTTNGFYLGYYAAAAGSTMDVTGGTLDINGTANIGREAQVTFTQTGGTVEVGNDLQLTLGGSAQATYNLDGGILDLEGSDVIFGPGTAAFNFTGGTLKDVGTFAFTLDQDGGTLAPGATIGTMNILGDYHQAAAGDLQIEINGYGQGTDPGSDYVGVDGNANLDGTLEIVLLDGFMPATGDTFDVVTTTTGSVLLGSTFGLDDSQAGLLPAQYWVATVLPGDKILQLSVGVPEPSTLVLAALGLLGMAFYGWRRKRK